MTALESLPGSLISAIFYFYIVLVFGFFCNLIQLMQLRVIKVLSLIKISWKNYNKEEGFKSN